MLPLAAKHNVAILPADSEHSAIFQCLQVKYVPALLPVTMNQERSTLVLLEDPPFAPEAAQSNYELMGHFVYPPNQCQKAEVYRIGQTINEEKDCFCSCLGSAGGSLSCFSLCPSLAL